MVCRMLLKANDGIISGNQFIQTKFVAAQVRLSSLLLLKFLLLWRWKAVSGLPRMCVDCASFESGESNKG